MAIAFLTKVMSLFISILVFFSSLSSGVNGSIGGSTEVELPDGGISVKYASGEDNNMSIYFPEDKTKADIIFILHGGSWIFGNETHFRDECVTIAENGFVGVTMDHTKLTAGVTAFDIVENEISAAIQKTADMMNDRGITPGKIILVGHSSGSHLILMYAYTHYEDCPVPIAFVISNSAPSDLLAAAEDGKTVLGAMGYSALSFLTGKPITRATAKNFEEEIKAVSPVYLVNPDVPPTIVVQGDKDMIVPYFSAERLYGTLAENGVDTILVTYEGGDHFLGENYPDGIALRSEAFYAFADLYL